MAKDLSEPSSKSFDQILQEIQQATGSARVEIPLKEILKAFGAERRGKHLIDQINSALKTKGLFSTPPIDRAEYYGSVTISKIRKGDSTSDPFPRLKDIPLNKLVSVQKEDSLSKAIALMIANDYSQLPILSNSRKVDGLVSWRSIGNALNLRSREITTVSQARENVDVMDEDSLFTKAIEQVLNDECILVRGKDGTITGIVTQFDVGKKNLEISNAFLTLKDTESFVRALIQKHLEDDELQDVRKNSPYYVPGNRITVSDLHFSEYVTIFSDLEYWKRFGIKLDQKTFCGILSDLVETRNAVMHYRADKAETGDSLRKIMNLIHSLDSHSD